MTPVVTRPAIFRRRLYDAVGRTICEMRVAAGMTQVDLARQVGMASGTLHRIEEGVIPCPLHHLVAMADVFDCSLDAIVPILTDAKEAAE